MFELYLLSYPCSSVTIGFVQLPEFCIFSYFDFIRILDLDGLRSSALNLKKQTLVFVGSLYVPDIFLYGIVYLGAFLVDCCLSI